MIRKHLQIILTGQSALTSKEQRLNNGATPQRAKHTETAPRAPAGGRNQISSAIRVRWAPSAIRRDLVRGVVKQRKQPPQKPVSAGKKQLERKRGDQAVLSRRGFRCSRSLQSWCTLRSARRGSIFGNGRREVRTICSGGSAERSVMYPRPETPMFPV